MGGGGATLLKPIKTYTHFENGGINGFLNNDHVAENHFFGI